jgi:Flp pilus assembly protein TadG
LKVPSLDFCLLKQYLSTQALQPGEHLIGEITMKERRTQKGFLSRPASAKTGVQRSNTRRRGLVAVYTAIGSIVFLGIAALVVDIGFRYWKRAETQKAADAAALAGAWYLPDHLSASGARAYARYYASLNGYTNGVNNTTVTTTWPVNGNPGRFRVDIVRPEPFFFAGLLKLMPNNVGATAVAELVSFPQLDVSGIGDYGRAVGDPVNLAVFGPNANRNNGDQHSPLKAPDGSDNKWYWPNGYDFQIKLPNASTYFSRHGTYNVQVGIFDPDCYNAGNVPDANGSTVVDELRNTSGGTGGPSDATTTRYQLIWEHRDNTGRMVRDVLGEKSWGNDSSTDAKWVQDSAFRFDMRNYTTGRLLLNVKTTAGSSENGFDLRAGPPHSTSMSESTWHSTYGNNSATVYMSADKSLPMNFNTSGTVTVKLGYLPAVAAGSTLSIGKFDTDVGAKSVVYTADTMTTWSHSGTLSGNGTEVIDKVPVPTNWTGGNIYATYQAGQQDTTVWSWQYTGPSPGNSQVFLTQ